MYIPIETDLDKIWQTTAYNPLCIFIDISHYLYLKLKYGALNDCLKVHADKDCFRLRYCSK